MLNLGDSFQNAQKRKREELLYSFSLIRVLVVDHKKDFLAYVAGVLHSCSFQVTCVDNSGAALRLLSEKKSEFDLLLIDSDISDVDIYTFLRLTKNMDLLFIVMSEKDDDEFLLKAFESGAFLVIKRPLTMDAVRHMRQDVMRERTYKHIKCENKNMSFRNGIQEIKLHENGSCGSKKRYQSLEEEDDDDVVNVDINVESRMKKKVCMEWTKELHDKFLGAVRQLGEGRCYPKKILDLMGVPGLTRMQVASHLQKCRKEIWKLKRKQRTLITSLLNQTLPSNLAPFGVNERRFGTMPSLQTNPNDQEETSALIGINLPVNGWQTEVNHMKNQTYPSSSMMNLSNQRNIAQRTQYAQFPSQNALGSNLDVEVGSRITNATSHHFRQAIYGVRDSGQGSNHHNCSSNRKQAYDDFPDFLRDSHGNGPNDI